MVESFFMNAAAVKASLPNGTVQALPLRHNPIKGPESFILAIACMLQKII